MAPSILVPVANGATVSATSMKSSDRELFLLTSAPFTVTCTAFIVTRNCNRHATHASANLRPNTPVMLKRTFQHPVSPYPSPDFEVTTHEGFKTTLCSRLMSCAESWIPQPRSQPASLTHRIPYVHEQTTKTEYARAVPVGWNVECDVSAVPGW